VVTTDPRFPIGDFKYPASVSTQERNQFIDQIASTPAAMRAALKELSDKQLNTPYRDGGWTVRQVVHHVPDSHMNAYVRFKLAMTEDSPTIKPYLEDRWAQLADTENTRVDVSLALLESLHERWVQLLRSLKEEDWKRTFKHPELGERRLDQTVALYAWHGRHHIAHVTALRQRMGW
jgi:uncharacterized damage-inducible protein DinB